MPKQKLDLDVDDNGDTMPTLRNQDTFKQLIDELGIAELMSRYKDEYLSFTRKQLFDPRQPRMFYRTEAQAKMAQAYGARLDELDQEYLASKKN